MSKLNLFARISKLEAQANSLKDSVVAIKDSLAHLTKLMESGEQYIQLRADYIEDCVNLLIEGLNLQIDLEKRTVTKKRKS